MLASQRVQSGPFSGIEFVKHRMLAVAEAFHPEMVIVINIILFKTVRCVEQTITDLLLQLNEAVQTFEHLCLILDDMARACSRNGWEEECMYLLVGSPEGKSPLRKLRRKWKGIKMNCGEIGWGGMNWINLAQVRDKWRALVSTAKKLRVP
jgi:hypothetical protein